MRYPGDLKEARSFWKPESWPLPMWFVFMRYMFIAYRVRLESDHRVFGDLFYAFCQELDDIGFVEAFHRIMTLAVEQLRQMGMFCERTAMVFSMQ